MKMRNVIIVGVAASCLLAVRSSANLVNDDFNRRDGSLVGTAPTPGPGGVWASHSGTLGDLLLSSGQAVVQHGIPSEDAHTLFADQTTGILSAMFDITVNDERIIGGTDSEYFAHFMEEGFTTSYRSRLDIVPANAGGDYTLGISTGSGTAEAIFPTDFSYGAPVNVTLSFDFAAGLSSVTVGGTTITSTTVYAGETLNAFALRQSDSSNNETILVDNLVVIPEPASLSLIGLVTGGIYFARRFFVV
jgi:hypothetical protein